MNSAETIRACMARVSTLRQLGREQPEIAQHLHWVKRFQSQRFAGTYADLLQSSDYAAAANFFLLELYGERDYTQRDAQFSRIAKALQTYFPGSVVATAVALAELHALTEEVDMEMARTSLQLDPDRHLEEAQRYVLCWRTLGREADRKGQLRAVLEVGSELDRLTRILGLRMSLRLMRGPAKAAGLNALQQFLEAGFDTFADMARKGDRAKTFVQTIEKRETTWIEQLFVAPETLCVEALRSCIQAGK